MNGLLTVTDDVESPVEAAADDDGVAAPKAKGDGAPAGTAKENPEAVGFAVNKTQQQVVNDTAHLLVNNTSVVELLQRFNLSIYSPYKPAKEEFDDVIGLLVERPVVL